MKTLRPISLFLIGLTCIAVTERSSFAKDTETAAKRHCLWQVRHSTNTVFLLGSVHMLRKDMYPLDPIIEDAYKQARVAVFETSFREMESPEFIRTMVATGSYSGDESLKQHVSEQTYSMLYSNLQSKVGSGGSFDRFKPWMAAMAFIGLEMQTMGYDATNGIDKYFFDRALRDDKEIVSLETPQSQLALLAGLSDADSEALLAGSLKEMASFRSLFSELMEAWRSGDTKAIESIILDAFRDYPAVQEKFLLDRNKAWVPKIEKLLRQGSKTLVVVGAAHLIGKESVVELLQKRGYTVEQR